MRLTTVKKQMPDGHIGYSIRNLSVGRMELEDICKRAGHGLANKNVIEMVVKVLAEEVCEYLRQGFIVDLGPLGCLHPGVKSGMKDNPDDFTWHDARPTVNIIPSKEMKRAVRQGTRKWFKARKNDKKQ